VLKLGKIMREKVLKEEDTPMVLHQKSKITVVFHLHKKELLSFLTWPAASRAWLCKRLDSQERLVREATVEMMTILMVEVNPTSNPAKVVLIVATKRLQTHMETLAALLMESLSRVIDATTMKIRTAAQDALQDAITRTHTVSPRVIQDATTKGVVMAVLDAMKAVATVMASLGDNNNLGMVAKKKLSMMNLHLAVQIVLLGAITTRKTPMVLPDATKMIMTPMEALGGMMGTLTAAVEICMGEEMKTLVTTKCKDVQDKVVMLYPNESLF
jgi:hypothetical protein